MPPEWGYPGPKIRAAIEDLNAARSSTAVPGRRHDPRPHTEPPFSVVEAAPAITFTLGRIPIDPDAQVRTQPGRVLPGLLAAGADAGGLAAALIFGLTASRTATRNPSGPRS